MLEKTNKVWGYEKLIVNEEYCGKMMFLKKGFSCSLHYHPVKDETFYILSGHMALETTTNGVKVTPLFEGDVFRITPNTPHRFYGVEDTVFFEFSTHDEASDSIRIEPSGEGPSKAIADFLIVNKEGTAEPKVPQFHWPRIMGD